MQDADRVTPPPTPESSANAEDRLEGLAVM
jgi:hypothetical protein